MTWLIQILFQFKETIGIAFGAIFLAFLAYFNGKKEEKNINDSEVLKRARQGKKISNNIANLSDADLDKRLQKYVRKRDIKQ